MVITKTYLRYTNAGVFGVIASPRANICLLRVRKNDKLTGLYNAVVPALENVQLWDLRKGEKVKVLHGSKSEVTSICPSSDHLHIAVGYGDGVIKIWNINSGVVEVTFSGHKSAVTVLNYDTTGSRLVSGSKDTDVIVWDIINESGLYRLKGHKGMITQCCFLKNENVLVTSSKDTFVKFWDLDTQHCFQTLVGHRTEVWGFTIIKNETRLITGCADSEMRIWEIIYKENNNNDNIDEGKRKLENKEETKNEDESCLSCTYLGSILRSSTERVVSLYCDQTEQFIACHAASSNLEIFRVSSDEEIKKRVGKRRKKMLKKQRSQEPDMVLSENTSDITATVTDELVKIADVRSSAKIRSFAFECNQDNELRVLLLLQNNTIEVHKLSNINSGNQIEDDQIICVKTPGHRSDPRSLCFNSDSSCILSGSSESVKIWNRATQKCIRTMSSGYVLSSLFVPGDRHVIIGTKAGKLQIFDISSGTLLENIDGHNGPVWSLSLAPDKTMFVSGSGDKEIKFWEFDLITDEDYSTTSKRLTICHVKTLQMNDDVLCVKYSANQKFIAVALLDSTIKVFFSDTLKFFLSLYGHKLPVVTMDISSDSTMLVSGSADKNIKIWGLDFGDCRKSIFAHDDSIMAVQFVPKTHYFFSASKDKTVKYWDADKFIQIMTLEGHHSEVWCLAISHDAEYVVSGSHDKSLRVWEKTDEPLVIEEEREMEREAAYEESAVDRAEEIIPGEQETESGKPGKKTMETIKGAERIMEAIELYKEERNKEIEYEMTKAASKKQFAKPAMNPIINAFGCLSPSHYVFTIVKKIRSSELEESLLVLPFDFVVDLLKLLNEWIKNGWEMELSCRCLFFLLRIHHNKIISTPVLLPIIDSLREQTRSKVLSLKDLVGFNIAGLQFLQRQLEQDDVSFYTDAKDKLAQIKKKKKAALTKFT